MNVRCIAPGDLTSAERAGWIDLCAGDPRTNSPFLHPGYAQAVARHQGGIEVAVCEENGKPVGFFPFRRLASGRGVAIGGRLSDYHGPLLSQAVAGDALALVKACGLRSWRFTHQPAGVPGFQAFEYAQSESPFLEPGGDFESYCAGRRAAGSGLIRQVQRKARKLEREQGPVRFEWQSDTLAVLEQLLSWKAEQRRRTRTFNILGEAWARSVVEDLHRTRGDEFGGVLSALYVGDRLIAAHFGVRTATTLHWWFPAYRQEEGVYSPGLILLLELVRACTERGVGRLDFGKGHEPYKDGFSTGAVPLAEGSVDTGLLQAGLGRGRIAAREWIRSSPLHAPMRRGKELFRAIRYR